MKRFAGIAILILAVALFTAAAFAGCRRNPEPVHPAETGTASSGTNAPSNTDDPSQTNDPSGTVETTAPAETNGPENTKNPEGTDKPAAQTAAPTPTLDPGEVNLDETPTKTPDNTPAENPTETPEVTAAPTEPPTPIPHGEGPYTGFAGKTYDKFDGLDSDDDLIAIDNTLNRLISKDMTDVEKIRRIHDMMVTEYYYDTSYLSRSASTLLATGTGVCQAYAELFAVYMEEAGFETKMVTGTAGGDAHAWNAVKLNGAWYYVDVTWDDPLINGTSNYPDGKNLRYKYLLVPETVISADHQNDEALPAPAGTSESLQAEATAAKLAELENELRAKCANAPSGTAFLVASASDREQVETAVVEALRATALAGGRTYKVTVYCLKDTVDVNELMQEVSSKLVNEAAHAFRTSVRSSAKVVNSEFLSSIEIEVRED
ncbi:MAG: hypothetical protein IKY07_05840 [Clostridia bacterium]|nr:hypothetical protein [Clostridia bacterium]